MSATVIILEETDFAGMNEEWIKWFPATKRTALVVGSRVSASFYCSQEINDTEVVAVIREAV